MGEAGEKGDMGEPGAPGEGGASVVVTIEPPGSNCAAGGVHVVSASGSGYVCHGASFDVGTSNVWTAGQTFASYQLQCPAGFTNITAAGAQLGCLQTAEEGTGNFYTAVDDCFDTYGATLPIYAEWYAAMANFTLSGETGNWEWLGSGNYWSQVGCGLAGNAAITDVSTADPNTASYQYRCWIPR